MVRNTHTPAAEDAKASMPIDPVSKAKRLGILTHAFNPGA